MRRTTAARVEYREFRQSRYKGWSTFAYFVIAASFLLVFIMDQPPSATLFLYVLGFFMSLSYLCEEVALRLWRRYGKSEEAGE